MEKQKNNPKNEKIENINDACKRRIIACLDRLHEFTTEEIEDSSIDVLGKKDILQQLTKTQIRLGEIIKLFRIIKINEDGDGIITKHQIKRAKNTIEEIKKINGFNF